jgi:hypothetical protein
MDEKHYNLIVNIVAKRFKEFLEMLKRINYIVEESTEDN